MRLIFYFTILLSGINAYSQALIEISNPSSFARNEEVIEIPWSKILNVYPGIDTAYFQVVNLTTKKQTYLPVFSNIILN